jgi:hypothetical protein
MSVSTETMNTLNMIKADVQDMQGAMTPLADFITSVETEGVNVPSEVDSAFADISIGLNTILTWVQQAIEDGGVTVPELTVMQNFLTELKVVFDKYKASISIVTTDGYGISYGESGQALRITVEDADGVVETKDFVQNSLSSDDLSVQ